MRRSISVCFHLAVGVLAVILMCAGSTQGDQYTVTAREMIRIYGDSSVSKETKFGNLQRLAVFYEQYRERIQFNEQEKQWADQLLLKYKQNFVDGAPIQGGNARIKLEVEGNVKDLEFKLKDLNNSSAGVNINRGTALFGLATIITCYVFRSM